MTPLRALKLVRTELRYMKRGVAWLPFIRFVAGRIVHRLRQRITDPNAFRVKWRSIAAPTDVARMYARVRSRTAPADPSLQAQPRTINWVMPDFGVSHGGALNIFRFVRLLEREGYKSRIYIDGPSTLSNGRQARERIREHFGPIDAEVFVDANEMAPAEFTFATTWSTAYTVRAFAGTRFKCYFVQDFEPFFYPRGSEYAFAENTYRFGFIGITAGSWLAETLRRNYGMRTFPIGLSYDKALYRNGVVLPKPDTAPRIFFYARPTTPRRGFDVGVVVLAEVVRRHPETEIVMAGWDLSAYDIPFSHVDKGALSLEELPDLFLSCDIALVLSYSNLSLLPLELMACGCAVVSNKGPQVEWLLSEDNSLLVDSDTGAMADAICHLIENPDRRCALQHAGLQFARATDWENEGRRLHGFLEQVRREGDAAVAALAHP